MPDVSYLLPSKINNSVYFDGRNRTRFLQKVLKTIKVHLKNLRQFVINFLLTTVNNII